MSDSYYMRLERRDIHIPAHVQYVAQDEDGLWYGYDWKPRPSENLKQFVSGRGAFYLAKGKPNADWKNTLYGVEFR